MISFLKTTAIYCKILCFLQEFSYRPSFLDDVVSLDDVNEVTIIFFPSTSSFCLEVKEIVERFIDGGWKQEYLIDYI